MTIQRISTQEVGGDGQASIVADVYSVDRRDRALQDVMSRLNIEPDVRLVSWEKIHS
jgi:hypothetical protein